jgi:HEAT repeat protein
VPQGQLNEALLMDLRRAQALDVAAWAAAALGELGAKRAVPLLLRTAEDPRDFFLRRSSLQSLIILDLAEARPVLMRRVEDPLPENRVLALYGLTVLADRAVIPLALARLKDEMADVRGQAVVALSTLGDAQVRPALEALRQKEDNPIVLRAIEDALTRLPR